MSRLRSCRLQDRDWIVGDYVLIVRDAYAVDLAVGCGVADIDDPGVGLAKSNLGQDGGDLKLEASRVDGDVCFGERLLRVLACRDRRVCEDHDKVCSREVGERVNAFRVAFGDGDLEPVVGEDPGRSADQSRPLQRGHVSHISGGENVSRGTLHELTGQRLRAGVAEGRRRHALRDRLLADFVEGRLERRGGEDGHGRGDGCVPRRSRAIASGRQNDGEQRHHSPNHAAARRRHWLP